MRRILEGYFDNNEIKGDDDFGTVYSSSSLDYKYYMKFKLNINDSLYCLKLYEKESNIYVTSTKLSKVLDNLPFIDDFKLEQTLTFGWNNEWQMQMKALPSSVNQHITDLDLSDFIEKFKEDTSFDYNDNFYKKPNITTEYSIKVLFNINDDVSYPSFFKSINILNKQLYNIHLWRKYEIGTMEEREPGIPVYDAEIDSQTTSHPTYVKTLYKRFWNHKDDSDLPSLRDVAYKQSHVEKIMNEFVQSSDYNVELKNIDKTSYHNHKNNTDYSVVFFDLYYTQKKHKELAKNQVLAELKNKVFMKLPLYFLRDWRFCIRIKSNKNFAVENSLYPKLHQTVYTDKKDGKFEEVPNNIGNSMWLTFPNFIKFYYNIDLHIKGYVMFLDQYNMFTERHKRNYYHDESFANLVQKAQK